jgi:acyl transferase domain-containing protein
LSEEVKRPIAEQVLDVLARLYVAGIGFNRRSLFRSNGQLLDLPTYPFERKTYSIPAVNEDTPIGPEMSPNPTTETIAPELPAVSEAPSIPGAMVLISPPVLSPEQRQASYRSLDERYSRSGRTGR